MDPDQQLNATERSIGDLPISGEPGKSVRLHRSYDAAIEDIWDACTTPERLSRWIGPVSGDLRLGGKFQIEGNASGEILRCEQPHLLRVTWVLGEGMSTEVQLTLTPEGSTTALELEHTAPAAVIDELVRSHGPGGTIGLGVGWDLALTGLDLQLNGIQYDPTTWEASDEVRRLAVRMCQAWGTVVQAAWQTSHEDTEAAVAFASGHYAPN